MRFDTLTAEEIGVPLPDIASRLLALHQPRSFGLIITRGAVDMHELAAVFAFDFRPLIDLPDATIAETVDGMFKDAAGIEPAALEMWNSRWMPFVRKYWSVFCSISTRIVKGELPGQLSHVIDIVDDRKDLDSIVAFAKEHDFHAKAIAFNVAALKKKRSADHRLAYDPVYAAGFALIAHPISLLAPDEHGQIQLTESKDVSAICLAHTSTPVSPKLPKSHYITSVLQQCGLVPEDTSFLCINYMLIAPEHRGKSAGHFLVDQLTHSLLEDAPSRPVLACVEVNEKGDPGALEFWRSEGFGFQPHPSKADLKVGHRVFQPVSTEATEAVEEC